MRPDHFDSELGIEILAGKNVDKGFDEAGNVLCALHAIPVAGRHVDDQMFAPHSSLHDDQRFDPRSA
jgi:hypothetical protein